MRRFSLPKGVDGRASAPRPRRNSLYQEFAAEGPRGRPLDGTFWLEQQSSLFVWTERDP